MQAGRGCTIVEVIAALTILGALVHRRTQSFLTGPAPLTMFRSGFEAATQTYQKSKIKVQDVDSSFRWNDRRTRCVDLSQ